MYLAPLNILRSMYDGTILDGELVKTKEGRWLYMVYDCLMTEGVPCAQKEFIDRIVAADTFVTGMKKLKTDPFAFRMKTFWNLSEFTQFYETIEAFPYETDGIVFTPVAEPIRSGTHETMFKWKPRDNNTIDFQCKRWEQQNKWGLYVIEKGKLVFESELKPEKSPDWLTEDCIVECQYMYDEQRRWWKPLNLRTDKTHPNNRRTFYRTLVNIKEDIQIGEFGLI
jgi:hypothetical protein